MADRNLVEPRNPLGEVAQIFEVQVVARIQSEALPPRLLRRCDIGRYGLLTAGAVVAGIGLGVKFHAVGAACTGPRDHRGIGIDEERDADTLFAETRRDVGQKSAVGDRVPPCVRRDGVGCVGHERNLRGQHFAHEVHERRYGIPFHIEFGPNRTLQVAHVGITNMTGIGPRMHGDPVGAETFDIAGGPHHIGQVSAARVA